MTGAQVIATSLRELGVTHIFGIVGIPVIEVAEACIAKGIRFVSFRNEQAATYAASAYGYLTGKPGVALVVGGPGVIHALSGVENANANCFPLMLLAGSSETHQRAKGAFQELNQVAVMKGFSKFAEQPATVRDVPRLLERAYRTSYFGRPGATYVDLPADIIQTKDIEGVEPTAPPGAAPRTLGEPSRIQQAAAVLKQAKNPLLVVGKGVAYARAEEAVRKLQAETGLQFLPTPMGKGVIPDDNAANVSAARSAALKSADAILLLGARLNWILHYGDAPKFQDGVQIVQVDVSPEELGNNAGSPQLGIAGDVGLVVEQLRQELQGWRAPPAPDAVVSGKAKNEKKAIAVENDTSTPPKYQPVYKAIRDTLATAVPSGRKVVYVSEGANTMDISRSSFPLSHARTRLDAGTNATMGLGMGYAIAAKVVHPDDVVVAIEGDSAFGFSLAEVETAVRSNLPMIIYVMNNSGVYHGVDPSRYDQVDRTPLPSTALQKDSKYHDLAQAFGADGYLATTLDEVRSATQQAVRRNRVAVINVIIDSGKDKKLEFGWMASTKPKNSKL